jgi:hypothetical protein
MKPGRNQRERRVRAMRWAPGFRAQVTVRDLDGRKKSISGWLRASGQGRTGSRYEGQVRRSGAEQQERGARLALAAEGVRPAPVDLTTGQPQSICDS